MTQNAVVKLALFAILVGIFIYRQYVRKKASKLQNVASDIETPAAFYSINDGNQTEVIFAPDYDKAWFDQLDAKYSWDDFDEYDNRFWEYMYRLFDTLPELSGRLPNPEFFNSLNREQKIFYCLLVFNGDVDNGGVSQFFFNKPEFAFAVLETFEALQMTKLKNDYEKCLNEFIGTSNSYAKRKAIFSDPSLEWEKRWKAFTNGYDDIKSAEKLEDYYWETDFKKSFYNGFVDYADKNIQQFVKGKAS